ncbi:hypothetical protein CVT25_003356 [Psilocybe cyanescens]|uniref:Uncharacterized protein n=1 Tax=Psilocybe cyanescens TaxID=93625 RepID=A0A409XQY2_PSICY|nr:hypothetical protein CVT25_003356 [Psilocybe cyanescens]
MLTPLVALEFYGSLNGRYKKEGINIQGQGQKSIALHAIKSDGKLGAVEEKKSKKAKDAKNSEEGKEKEDGAKKTSSFEVGALTSSPGVPLLVASKFLGAGSGANANANVNAKTLGAKKSSSMLLGLGLPSTIQLSSSAYMRAGSSASSVGPSVSGLALSLIVASAVNPNLNNTNAHTSDNNRVPIESAFYAARRP